MSRLEPRTVPHAGKRLAADLLFTSGPLTGQHLKRVLQFKPCPSCGKPMATISSSQIYECKGCRVFVTEPHDR
jgi:hypothetical protein